MRLVLSVPSILCVRISACAPPETISCLALHTIPWKNVRGCAHCSPRQPVHASLRSKIITISICIHFLVILCHVYSFTYGFRIHVATVLELRCVKIAAIPVPPHSAIVCNGVRHLSPYEASPTLFSLKLATMVCLIRQFHRRHSLAQAIETELKK